MVTGHSGFDLLHQFEVAEKIGSPAIFRQDEPFTGQHLAGVDAGAEKGLPPVITSLECVPMSRRDGHTIRCRNPAAQMRSYFRIFESLISGPAATQSGSSGSGLGFASNLSGCYSKGKRLWGNVYVTSSPGLADFSVFQSTSAGLADIRVYRTTSPGLASSCGVWYFTSSPGLADFSVYFTSSSGLADFRLYYTSSWGLAGV